MRWEKKGKFVLARLHFFDGLCYGFQLEGEPMMDHDSTWVFDYVCGVDGTSWYAFMRR